MTERATGSRMKRGTSPPREKRDHLHVRHFLSFQFQLKKKGGDGRQNFQNLVTVKQESGTIKCDT